MEHGQTTAPLGWERPRLESWTPAGMERGCNATDAALCLAFAYVRLTEETLDAELDKHGSPGLERFQDYVLGVYDGVPKTPHWAAYFTGIPSYTIRALARHWGSGAGPGSAFGSEKELEEIVSRAESLHKDSFVGPRSRFTGLPPTLIGGTVYDYETDEVLEEALVTISYTPSRAALGTEEIGEAELTVLTGTFGNFLVDQHEPGKYVVSIEKEGYAPRQWGPFEVEDGGNLQGFPMFFDFKEIIWW